MQREFIPKICKEIEGETLPSFKGSLMLEVPTTPERLRILSKAGLSVGLDGQAKFNKNSLDGLADLMDQCKPLILSVNLENQKTGEKIESADQLYCDEECSEILNELCDLVIYGFKPEKKVEDSIRSLVRAVGNDFPIPADLLSFTHLLVDYQKVLAFKDLGLKFEMEIDDFQFEVFDIISDEIESIKTRKLEKGR